MNVDWGKADFNIHSSPFNIHSSALDIQTVYEAVVDILCVIS